MVPDHPGRIDHPVEDFDRPEFPAGRPGARSQRLLILASISRLGRSPTGACSFLASLCRRGCCTPAGNCSQILMLLGRPGFYSPNLQVPKSATSPLLRCLTGASSSSEGPTGPVRRGRCWKDDINPNAQWTTAAAFRSTAPRKSLDRDRAPTTMGRITNDRDCDGALADGRLQVWEVVGSDRIQSRWKEAPEPTAAWSPWRSFPFPPTTLIWDISVGPLSDGRLQLFAADINGQVWSCWKVKTIQRQPGHRGGHSSPFQDPVPSAWSLHLWRMVDCSYLPRMSSFIRFHAGKPTWILT